MRCFPRCPVIVLAMLISFGTMRAEAVPIAVVSASTTMGSGLGTALINTVNGAGLTPNTLTGLHGATLPNNSWVSAGMLTGLVTFDFGALFDVSGFSFWNQNGGGPGLLGSTGVNAVQVLYSANGTTFSPLFSGNFARVQAVVPVGPETFAFTAVAARAFRFNILSNHGDIFQTGFAEVKFDSAQVAVPEPASFLLFGAAAVGLISRSRRRRRAGRL